MLFKDILLTFTTLFSISSFLSFSYCYEIAFCHFSIKQILVWIGLIWRSILRKLYPANLLRSLSGDNNQEHNVNHVPSCLFVVYLCPRSSTARLVLFHERCQILHSLRDISTLQWYKISTLPQSRCDMRLQYDTIAEFNLDSNAECDHTKLKQTPVPT